MDKFVQRSSGVFGATGTGKSFLTRLVLAGLMKHNQASVLVLDMHNEYGFDDVASDTKKAVKGLKTLFKRSPMRWLGSRSTIRGNQVDFNLEISTGDISTVILKRFHAS
jgi:DNA helicase HerA-like ATPase